MARYWELEHAASRAIKRGERVMQPPFSTLADWIAEEYCVPRPLNVRLDTVKRGPMRADYRLDIVFEHEGLQKRFRDADGANFDFDKQDAIKAKFLELRPPDPSVARTSLNRILPPRPDAPLSVEDAERLFVIFTEFEAHEREEANGKLTQAQIKRIEKDLRDVDIWKVYPAYGSVIFLFETDIQRDACRSNGAFERCLSRYNQDLLAHDEFGYFSRNPIHTRIESRETFKRDYGGSWQAFLR